MDKLANIALYSVQIKKAKDKYVENKLIKLIQIFINSNSIH